ncbi:UNVERIFIED_CONTAM: hypothetical protein FKN15_030857 [Acipenser sinensis]
MLCANASGSHRLPALLLGTAAKPRCFKNVNLAALPVVYKSQKRAWMDQDIFHDWFHNHFVTNVKQKLQELGLPPKAVLLLDNAPFS